MIQRLAKKLFLAATFMAGVNVSADGGSVSITRFEQPWDDKHYTTTLYAFFKNTTSDSQIVYYSFDADMGSGPNQKGRVSRCIEMPANSTLGTQIGVTYSKYPSDQVATVTRFTNFKVDEVVPFSRGAEDGNWPELLSHYRVSVYNRNKSRRPYLFRVSRVPDTEEILDTEKGEITQTVTELGIRFAFVRKKESPQLTVDSVYRLKQAKKLEKENVTLAGAVFHEQYRDEMGFYHDKVDGNAFLVRGYFPADQYGANGTLGEDAADAIVRNASFGIGSYLLNIDTPKLQFKTLKLQGP